MNTQDAIRKLSRINKEAANFLINRTERQWRKCETKLFNRARGETETLLANWILRTFDWEKCEGHEFWSKLHIDLCKKAAKPAKSIIAYKVVHNGGSLIDGLLQYKIGQTTYPTFGKIFIFKNLEDAKKFVPYPLPEILKGVAVNPCKLKHRVANIYASSDHELFWKEKSQKKKHSMPLQKTPKGTYVCDSFTPVPYMEFLDKGNQ
jgi:hypothetical protein